MFDLISSLSAQVSRLSSQVSGLDDRFRYLEEGRQSIESTNVPANNRTETVRARPPHLDLLPIQRAPLPDTAKVVLRTLPCRFVETRIHPFEEMVMVRPTRTEHLRKISVLAILGRRIIPPMMAESSRIMSSSSKKLLS
jgi:hypothetical protein